MIEKVKTQMQVIEDKIEDLIASSDNDALMEAWLEFLEEKNKRAKSLIEQLEAIKQAAEEKTRP